MSKMRTRFDSAYRRFLRNQYTKHGFTTYRMYSDIDGNSFVSIACYYCGDWAASEDHTMPLITLYALLATEESIPSERLIVVPACRDCNNSLGTKIFPSLLDRKRYIKERLRIRFKKELALPLWHEQELETLGATLRSAVLHGITLQRKIRERLAW